MRQECRKGIGEMDYVRLDADGRKLHLTPDTECVKPHFREGHELLVGESRL